MVSLGLASRAAALGLRLTVTAKPGPTVQAGAAADAHAMGARPAKPAIIVTPSARHPSLDMLTSPLVDATVEAEYRVGETIRRPCDVGTWQKYNAFDGT